MLLMIDNYDSFTYNLVQYFGELGEEVRVFRNDEIDVDGIAALRPERARALARAVLAGRGRRLRRRRSAPSPASCRSSASASATRRSARRSAARSCAPQRLMHGKAERRSRTDGRGVYAGAARARSRSSATTRWRSSARRCRAELEVTSTASDGEIMGVRHRELAATTTPLEGVQFHPESILTEHGHAMLKNFLEATR